MAVVWFGEMQADDIYLRVPRLTSGRFCNMYLSKYAKYIHNWTGNSGYNPTIKHKIDIFLHILGINLKILLLL